MDDGGQAFNYPFNQIMGGGINILACVQFRLILINRMIATKVHYRLGDRLAGHSRLYLSAG